MNSKTQNGKAVKGSKYSIGSFVRPSDGQRIFIFPRRGERKDAATQRVLKHNGAIGTEVVAVIGGL